MNDDDMLAAMRSSLTGTKDALTHVHMDRRPEAIMARARGRRLRGVAGVGTGGLALAIGLALSLSGGTSVASGGHPGAPSSSSATRAVHVNLAAWSVNTSPNGLVEVTIRELKDPARLAKTLADAGVPVVLTSGPVCASSDGQLELQVSQVVRKLPGPGGLVMSINPKAMPAGTELVIGIGTLRIGSQQGPAAAFDLQKKGSPLNCPGKPKAATN
ncbi:hypothetical protein GCM10023194_67580 [Planotetraspora phitsanulokensis]|uniref:Uncharacterized protein n=1 Tax=Planotetraspora phitsanulokensis TaxID=575192 RepID=A0A8J3XG51_9ACTN|nr:hypothetical protein [Planotetraspora phitsanulokensis]GII39679.1 hypothetical protein Pph01_46820 [Planotetraspora phitsanulokensis]